MIGLVRSAVRSLLRAPGFMFITALILAVGLGCAIVMIALIQGVVLRPLPVRDQDRLLVAWKTLPASGFMHYPFGDKEIEEAARASRLLEEVAGISRHGVSEVTLVEDGAAEYANQAWVTGAFFEVLGARPLLGRTFTRADDVQGAEDVVVISHRFWQRRYSGAHDVIGRGLPMGDRRFAIIGVMPPGLDFPRDVDFWRTTASITGIWGDAARSEVDLIGRLRPGATIGQATTELAALTRRFEVTAPPDATRGFAPVVRSLHEVVVGDVRTILLALVAAAALVLVIAAANAANLLAMRNETRRTELAVRMALGAGRGRIAATVLVESLALSIAAGAAGLVLAWWSLQALVALVPLGLPRAESIRIDAAVAFAAMLVVMGTGALTAVAPAWLIDRDLVSYLKSGGRGAPGVSSRRARRSFVVAQVAFALTILTAASLLARTVMRLQAIDVGLPTDRLAFVDLSMPVELDRNRHAEFLNRLIDDLAAVPVVAGATPVNGLPFSGVSGWDVPVFTAEGQSADEAAANPSLNLEAIFPNFFSTLEVPIVRGRAFSRTDRSGTPEVAIISDDIAARTWPGEDPIGKRLKMGGAGSKDEWRTVVGVAASTRYRELTRDRPTLYLPAEQFLMTAQRMAVRTSAPLDTIAAIARDRVRAIEPSVFVREVVSFGDILARPFARPRFNAFLLSLFGAISVLLSTVGIYAVMAAYVRQRDRDIAVRRALGATAMNVRRLVLGEAMSLVAMGAAIGLAGAVLAERLLHDMLYAAESLDLVALSVALVLLTGISILAAYLPARRAARVDPLAALRYE